MLPLFVLFVSTGTFFSGCDTEKAGMVKSELVGEYELIEVDGNKVPAQLTHGSTQLEVLEGSLIFSENGVCKSITKFKPVSGTEIKREVEASYTQEGEKVTMKWKGAGVTSGTVDGETFTMNNEGMIFIYTKKQNI